ncbi:MULTISPECIES: GNAT family N-acetyltransferase [Bacillaceae]|uniref:GNAT family N-acetyltransferase n=1 Tax=Evansella alkalicola TaxID=745819 RepID=A0ABS6JWS2_9BACI|nr:MULTISPECIES: GNAT family N-acetyltransferase [Bacillaceae]MBU9723041.1 GNAT family N-acetyltransferase [Bacillus alkalicola]
MKITERTLRIIKNAEKEAEKTNEVVHPVHLLLGLLKERTSVCAELNNNYPGLGNILEERFKDLNRTVKQGISYKPYTKKIALSTKRVMENANNLMKRYNQIYLNEGHIVDAIISSKDDSTKLVIDGLNVLRIRNIVSFPRDMIVSLRSYSFPNILLDNITFRQAEESDAIVLKNFIQKEFGDGWLASIENGFLKEDIPIFIALDNKRILGFACFDVVRNKKGLFGPMGTTRTKRLEGIGYTLLHMCLNEMKQIGYEYAVIGEAGPLEFYEKACNAVVIPKTY